MQRIGVVVCLAIACVGCGAGDPTTGSRPDDAPPRSIILVVVDTLRADHLSVYGYDARPTSPALERRSASAAVFEEAYSSAPWTLPAVGSILTGRWPTIHGAGLHRREHDKASWTAMDEEVATLPELLRDAGYATAGIVNNWYLNERFGVDRGFGHYDWRNGTDSTWRPASESVDLALAWLGRHREEPHFLMLHLMEPHFSYRAPEGYEGRFRTAAEMEEFPVPHADAGLIADRKDELTERQWELIRAAYDEEIRYVDDQLERLFSGLEKTGLWENALVVLTSDHGEEFYDHGGYGHSHEMYDETTQVPLLVWWSRATPGRIDVPVSLVDILPTMARAAGVDPAPTTDGISLVPLLTERREPERRLLMLERDQFDLDYSDVGLVAWPHKLLVDDDGVELFHLGRDPRERRNLTPRNPKRAGRLHAILTEKVAELMRSAADGGIPELDDADRRALRALGYIR